MHERTLMQLRTMQALISLRVSLCYLLTESMYTVVYGGEQRMSRSDCTDAHAHLDRCSHMAWGLFTTLRFMWRLFCRVCSPSIPFWCLGKAVLRDCGISWVSSFIFLLKDLKINVKRIAFENKEHTKDQKMGVAVLLRLL